MNNYEAPEALKLGKAQDVILDMKHWWPQFIDNLGVNWCSDAPSFDDFDE